MVGTKLKILVADDDAFVREILMDILVEYGYEVEAVDNGKKAFDKIQNDTKINLVISDMNMPELDGMGLIKTLRKSGSEIPIIILTANNEIAVAIKAMSLGANDYLLKDEHIQDTILISVIKVMDKYQLEMQNQRLMEELAKKNKELERLAFLDGLTGIANRRYFEGVIHQEWGRAARESYPVGLIMIDIDFFKSYNDSYGHQKGDDCLIKVAGALSDAIRRAGDFVSRYGGEEFIAILPNSDPEGAFNVAETMRRNVANLQIPHKGSTIAPHVTVSLGVGSMVPQRQSTPSDLIDRVDKALYSAKQAGRNTIKKVV